MYITFDKILKKHLKNSSLKRYFAESKHKTSKVGFKT